MGPILIFDKSALQGLRLRETALLNTLFLTNITPLFYVETLADLEKADPRQPHRGHRVSLLPALLHGLHLR